MKKWKQILGIGMAAVFLAGCGQAQQADSDSAAQEATEQEATGEPGTESLVAELETEVTESSTEPEIDLETMELIKYNIYIELNNYAIEVINNISSYYMVVADEEEFSLLPDTGLSYGYDISYLNTEVLDNAEAVVNEEPVFEGVDELASQLVPEMRIMMDAFNEISDAEYTYAENQYALPKEIHPIIQHNVSAFLSVADEYLAAVDTLSDQMVAKDEQKMVEEGRMITYYSSHAITVANEILNACTEQGVDDYNLLELDLSQIEPLYNELKLTVESYNEACSDNNQLINESLSSPPFDGLFDSLLQAVEWMMDQVENQEPLYDPSLAQLGSIAHIGEVLSDCINRYNSVFAS